MPLKDEDLVARYEQTPTPDPEGPWIRRPPRTTPPPPSPYASTREAATLVTMNLRTFREYAALGLIPGRIRSNGQKKLWSKEVLKKWMEQGGPKYPRRQVREMTRQRNEALRKRGEPVPTRFGSEST